MSKLDEYHPEDQRRIVALMSQLVAGRVESGEIECTDKAIKAAMPQALADAKATITAMNEYLCG
jgi:hypothetical protein